MSSQTRVYKKYVKEENNLNVSQGIITEITDTPKFILKEHDVDINSSSDLSSKSDKIQISNQKFLDVSNLDFSGVKNNSKNNGSGKVLNYNKGLDSTDVFQDSILSKSKENTNNKNKIENFPISDKLLLIPELGKTDKPDEKETGEDFKLNEDYTQIKEEGSCMQNCKVCYIL